MFTKRAITSGARVQYFFDIFGSKANNERRGTADEVKRGAREVFVRWDDGEIALEPLSKLQVAR